MSLRRNPEARGDSMRNLSGDGEPGYLPHPGFLAQGYRPGHRIGRAHDVELEITARPLKTRTPVVFRLPLLVRAGKRAIRLRKDSMELDRWNVGDVEAYASSMRPASISSRKVIAASL